MDREVMADGTLGNPTGDAREQRTGAALVAVLLLGTAVALLAHAALVLGLALERSARGDARTAEVDAHLDARLVAVSATHESLHDPLPPDAEGRLLTPELLRIRIDSAGRGRVGLLWAPDPSTRLDALVAGVRTPLVIAPATAGRIVMSATDSCGVGLEVPADFETTASLPWSLETPATLGPLDSADWAGLPPPSAEGGAGGGAWRAAGPLTLGGGAWEGMLVVEGSLALADGAAVSGWVVVTGDVVVREGARIEGVIRAGGGVTVEEGGIIEVAPCRAVRALPGLPPFAFPVPVGGGTWALDPLG